MLVSAFGAGLGEALPKEIVQSIYSAIAKSQSRKVWRRAIRDAIEDEVKMALLEHGVPNDVVNEYIKDNKDYYKQEARNRFDHALQERE